MIKGKDDRQEILLDNGATLGRLSISGELKDCLLTKVFTAATHCEENTVGTITVYVLTTKESYY